MTDRVYALSVALEHDIREDDVQSLVKAIEMLRGVLTVGVNISDASQWVAQERARSELMVKLLTVLRPPEDTK